MWIYWIIYISTELHSNSNFHSKPQTSSSDSNLASRLFWETMSQPLMKDSCRLLLSLGFLFLNPDVIHNVSRSQSANPVDHMINSSLGVVKFSSSCRLAGIHCCLIFAFKVSLAHICALATALLSSQDQT